MKEKPKQETQKNAETMKIENSKIEILRYLYVSISFGVGEERGAGLRAFHVCKTIELINLSNFGIGFCAFYQIPLIYRFLNRNLR